MPHFFAPALRLLERPMTWQEWRAVMPVRIDASLSSSPATQLQAHAPTNTTSNAFESVRDVSHWGQACLTGWVRDSRFGSGQVIKGTSRAKSRKNMMLNTWENAR
jgi:hypothetical protein